MKIRDQILQILNSSEGHMTAEEMYLFCVNNDIKISMASTYRVLGKLAEEGLIRKISVAGQPDIFDRTTTDHQHLICVSCGKVTDIMIDGLRDAISEKIKEEFYSYDLCIKYVCEDCQNKEKK